MLVFGFDEFDDCCIEFCLLFDEFDDGICGLVVSWVILWFNGWVRDVLLGVWDFGFEYSLLLFWSCGVWVFILRDCDTWVSGIRFNIILGCIIWGCIIGVCEIWDCGYCFLNLLIWVEGIKC